MQKFLAQGYDGAAIVSGYLNGLQSLVENIGVSSVLFITVMLTDSILFFHSLLTIFQNADIL